MVRPDNGLPIDENRKVLNVYIRTSGLFEGVVDFDKATLDPATGHILKSTGKAAGVEFTTTYSDFRKVEGLLFAFREDNTAQGMKTGTNEISKVEISLRK